MNISPVSPEPAIYTSTDQPARQPAAAAVTPATAQTGDTLEISDASRRLGLMSQFLDGAASDGVVTLDELRDFRDKKLAETQDILRDTLASLGFQPRGKLDFARDGSGNFTVTGGGLTDAQRDRLEEALTNDSAFQNAYAATASTSTIIAAGEAHVPFAEAYARDPQAAVRQYSWLFSGDWDFHLSYERGEASFDVSHT